MRHSYDLRIILLQRSHLFASSKCVYFLQRIGSTSKVSLSTLSAVQFFGNKHDDESKSKQTLLPLFSTITLTSDQDIQWTLNI